MPRTLDRSKPFGNIFGVDDHGAVFTQGNAKFNGQGQEVGDGVSQVLADPPRVAVAGPAPVVPAPVPIVPAVSADAELAAMHPAKISKLVTEAGLTPFGGAGSKAKNIEQLIAFAAAAG